MMMMPSCVSKALPEVVKSDLLEVLVGDLLLDLDEVIVIVVLRLSSLSFSLALSLGHGSLGLLGRSRDFIVIRAVVVGRQDDGRRALLGRLGSRGLCSTALDGSVILSVHLLLECSPSVADRADGEAGALGELQRSASVGELWEEREVAATLSMSSCKYISVGCSELTRKEHTLGSPSKDWQAAAMSFCSRSVKVDIFVRMSVL